MDETPAFFDMVPSKCIAKKGERECVFCFSGSENKRLMIVLPRQMDKCSTHDHFQEKK